MRPDGPGQSILLLLDVIDVLDRLNIPYAVVGALAASFYGVIRASVDADAVISLGPGQEALDGLLDSLKEFPVETTVRKGELGDPVGAVINVEDKFRNRVDLLLGIRGMDDALYSRTLEAEFMQAGVRFIGIEDFIAMKLFAGSPKDLNDASGAIEVSGDRIDYKLLRQAAGRYGDDCLKNLELLLNRGR